MELLLQREKFSTNEREHFEHAWLEIEVDFEMDW